MLRKIYTTFIAPKQRDPDTRNRVIVLNMLLVGTLLLMIGAFTSLVLYLITLQYYFLDTRIFAVGASIAFVLFLYRLSRRGHFRPAATLLVLLYFLIASLVVYRWGIVIATGVLLYGLVIVLSGILLGPLYSLYFAAASSIMLYAFQAAADYGLIHPDWLWLTEPPDLSDAIGTILIFIITALVSWLFNFQMDRSLHRAMTAETALTKQKDLLETTVQERTSQLQAAQLEKIQQMYRFAELGQLSTALLHDLSNHLTSLTLDIEGLKGQTRSRLLGRARRSIRYIDDMVVRVRDQLHGRSDVRPFNVTSEVEAMVAMLNHRAAAAAVRLIWQPPTDKKPLRCLGEPIRFRQMIANLISNGIDAYYTDGPEADRREVAVTASVKGRRIVITISDWGRGIPAENRKKLFEPFYSTKKTGMGMGLFIVRQIAEEHFLGSVTIDESQDHTVFVVSLPKASA